MRCWQLGGAAPPRMTRGSFDASLGPFLAAVVFDTLCQEARRRRRGAVCHVNVFGRRVTDEEAFLDAATGSLADGPRRMPIPCGHGSDDVEAKKRAPPGGGVLRPALLA